MQRPLLLILFALLALAQGERATVTGVVSDSSQAVVPGAQIVLRNTATNVTLVASNYAINNMDRTSMMVWTGGAATMTLPTAQSVGKVMVPAP